MFNATSSIVKQNHEAGSHTGLSGSKLFPHLQRTPEFYTIAKTLGKLRCVYWLRSFACFRNMIERFGQKCRSRQGYPMVETRRRSLGPRQISFPQSR
jgi:hypothetical protein